MGRSPCCDENGLKKGPWTPEEDQKLVLHIQKHGHGCWRALPKLAGLNRCGKSCRLRWTNYLRPDIKRGKFSQEEEETVLNLHSILGNKWSAISTHLPGRTDNEIKNFWNTHLRKKLIQMGFDPMTHRPRTDIFSSLPHLLALANISELMVMEHHPWEEQAVRLQTEAVQLAKLQYLQHLLQSATPLTNNSYGQTSITEMEAFNLLNSISQIKENPSLNSPQLEMPTLSTLGMATTQPLHDYIPFSHLPGLQVPCSSQTPLNNDQLGHGSDFTVFNQGDISPESLWLPPSPSPPSPPPTNEVLMSNLGDACGTSSYGGGAPSFWPELLLDDPFLHEIA